MKKIIIFLIIVLIIVVSIFVMYSNYKVLYNNIKKDNLEFEYYSGKELQGIDIATILNKAIDNNIKYNVQKDEEGKYVENNETSIKVQIYILDNNKTYDMETIYSGGIDKFVQNYSTIKFKCTKIDYHKKNNRIKTIYIEQISK